MGVRACVVLAIAIAIALLGDARADEVPEEVAFSYTAPAECPDRAAVIDLVRSRTPLVKFQDNARRTFAIEITKTADGYAGALVVGQSADKQLAATRCDDLVTALSLVTALAIDPDASSTAPPPKPVAPSKPAPRDRWTFDGLLGLAVDGGVTPGALFSGVLAVRAGRRSFAVELGLLAGRDASEYETGTATFTWLAARPAGCWVPRRDLAACGHAEIGAMTAAGDDVINGRAVTRLWLTAGAHASGRLALWSSRAFAQLQLGFSVPLARDRYRFMPDIEIHQTPAVTGWVAIGVGMHF